MFRLRLALGGSIGPSRGIDIGSEMSGDVYDVTVRNIRMHDVAFAARIKSGRGRGGKVASLLITFGTVLQYHKCCPSPRY